MFDVASWDEALASPVSRGLLATVAGALVVSTLIIAALSVGGKVGAALRKELWLRLGSWMVLLPAMIAPVLAGPEWTVGATTILGILCLHEYSRATGLLAAPSIYMTALGGLLLANFAALDNWYGLFAAVPSLTIALMAVVSIPSDSPQGYIQRTGLGVFGFMLFGSGLAHLGYMSNYPNYRPLILTILLCVALNDVAAFCVGRLVRGPKLLPNTSPGKTISGAVGALLIVAPLVSSLAGQIFKETRLDDPWLLAALGLLVSAAGQAGDLMLSSIKRDLGIKDMGTSIPGHGGILDRYNSLLVVAPAVFHLVNYFVALGKDRPVRVVSRY